MPGIDKLPIEETLEDSPQVREARRSPVGGGQIGPDPVGAGPSADTPRIPSGRRWRPPAASGRKGGREVEALRAAGRDAACMASCLPVRLARVAWQGLGASSGGSRAVSFGAAPCEEAPGLRRASPLAAPPPPGCPAGGRAVCTAGSSGTIFRGYRGSASGVRAVVCVGSLTSPPLRLHS